MVIGAAYPLAQRAAIRPAQSGTGLAARAGSAVPCRVLGGLRRMGDHVRALLLNSKASDLDLRGITPQKGHPMKPAFSAFAPVVATALALALFLPGAARASNDLPPLREVEEIDRNMLWVALAIEISDKCDQIAPRNLKGLLVLNDLRGQARNLGYSNAQIEEYATSDAEKARMRELGEQYVKSQGLDPDVTADLCSLGSAEIARNSRIGALLKAK